VYNQFGLDAIFWSKNLTLCGNEWRICSSFVDFADISFKSSKTNSQILIYKALNIIVFKEAF